jgi:hypothetical protein
MWAKLIYIFFLIFKFGRGDMQSKHQNLKVQNLLAAWPNAPLGSINTWPPDEFNNHDKNSFIFQIDWCVNWSWPVWRQVQSCHLPEGSARSDDRSPQTSWTRIEGSNYRTWSSNVIVYDSDNIHIWNNFIYGLCLPSRIRIQIHYVFGTGSVSILRLKPTQYSEKRYWPQSVFWLSLQLLSETFLILRRIQ